MSKKTVLVTGASRGIGKAVALKFAQKGYRVAINCVSRRDDLMQVKKEVESYQTECLAYVGDVGVYDNCREMFDLVKKQFGSPDVLVNNAGISYIGLFQDMTPEDCDRVIRVNLDSVFYFCKLALPDMISRKSGRIINVSSVWGTTGASCETAYSAAKGGVNALTRALAKEAAPSGIQVNAVACGAIDTEMNSFMSDEELISLIDEIPMNRLGKASEVADLVYHLAYKAGYLTGQVITLDGGWI